LSLILYINGSVADLSPNTVIAQTRQVNDLNSLDDRQASYTNKFSLPKIANNMRIMNYLTLTGNTSNIPYQKNECSLYSATGECFVFNGWAVVTDGGDSYDVVIYDGIIDLYKAVENKNLSALGLDDLTHKKTFAAIKDSWDTSLENTNKYAYILADYNGDNTVANPPATGLSVNFDYLVPAVKVSYLWEKIFGTYGFSWSGSVFNSDDFKNLWLTFPKGVPNLSDQNPVLFDATHGWFVQGPNTVPHRWLGAFADTRPTDPDPDPNDIINANSPSYIKINQAGRYYIEISATVNASQGSDFYHSPVSATNVFLALNVQNQPVQNIPYGISLNPKPNVPNAFIFAQEMDLPANTTLTVVFGAPNYSQNAYYINNNNSIVTLKITKRDPSQIDFSQAFADFSIRDFLTEIVQRFGLTMYKRRYENHYEFLTLHELLETGTVADWSSKFVKKLQEEYVTGNYAQQNWFRYAYNDKEQSHNDGYLTVLNANLNDSTDLFKSRIYSPEKQTVTYLGRTTNVYKLWDKEIKENPAEGEASIKYKPLDKRYYLMRAERKNTSVFVKSNANPQQNGTCTSYLTEDYTGLPFSQILQTYYAPLQRILEKTIVVSAQLWLSEADVANFDFKKKYYIAQLGGNFVMNKITNYVPGKPTTCEMVRVA